jgi:hypothetical protein
MKSVKKHLSRNRIQSVIAILVVLVVAIAGVHLLVSSHAQSPYVAMSAASGTLAGGASLQSDITASNGNAVHFGPAVYVKGNQLVNGQGKVIRLLGVNASGTESACVQTNSPTPGWGPGNATEAAAIASWKINAVRIPLNEDCWLAGTLGVPGVTIKGKTGADAAQLYQTYIKNWVTALNDAGIIAILDLHISAPGSILSTGQYPMADESHSPDFWTSVASTFKANPGVMYDLFNEPSLGNNPDDSYSNGTSSVSPWNCWLNGCKVTVTTTSTTNPPQTTQTSWQAAGMQELVSAVRDTEAKQPILLGGLDFSGDPCGRVSKPIPTTCPEIANMPKDPGNSLIVDYHNYYNADIAPSLWTTHWADEIDPITHPSVGTGIPVVTDEFGENDCNTTFMTAYMNWADQNNQSYLAWAWLPYGAPISSSQPQTCYTPPPQTTPKTTDYSWVNWDLLQNWTGTPSNTTPQGCIYQAHLEKLATGITPTCPPESSYTINTIN